MLAGSRRIDAALGICLTGSLSLRLQPRAAVDAQHFGVHVGVGEQLDDHRRELLGPAEPLREEHIALERVLERLRRRALTVDRGVEQPGRDTVEAYADD